MRGEFGRSGKIKKAVLLAAVLALGSCTLPQDVFANTAVSGTDSNTSREPASATAYKAVAVGDRSEASGSGAIAIGDSTASGTWSIAIGDGAQATSSEEDPKGASIAIGSDSKASEDYATAIGASAAATGLRAFAAGTEAAASGIDAMALGNFSVAKGEESIAFGYSADALTFGSIAFGRDSEASGGIVASAFGYGSKATQQVALALGAFSQATGVASVAIGGNSQASNTIATAVGYANYATGEASSVLGNNSTAQGTAAVAIGYQSVANTGMTEEDGDTVKYVSFGHKDGDEYIYTDPTTSEIVKGNYSGNSYSRLTNVAKGTAANEAATWDQLVSGISYDAGTGVLTLSTNDVKTSYTTTITGGSGGDGKTYQAGTGIEITNPTSTTPTISVKADGKVESGNTGLVTGGTVYDALKDMDNQVGSLSDDINKVGAGAAALAALRPEAFNPNDRWSFAVGYGHYKNANAGALGVFYKPSADTTVSFSSTIGNGDPMMNAGLSFKLGQRGKNAGAYRNAVDLVARVDALEATDARHETLIAALRADNEKMKKQIAQILSKMEMAEKVKKTAK